jgi:hypothetical protein
MVDKTAEQGQLAPALAHHREVFGRAPRMVTGDRGLHAPENEQVARAAGAKHLVIPHSGVVNQISTSTRPPGVAETYIPVILQQQLVLQL